MCDPDLRIFDDVPDLFLQRFEKLMFSSIIISMVKWKENNQMNAYIWVFFFNDD